MPPKMFASHPRSGNWTPPVLWKSIKDLSPLAISLAPYNASWSYSSLTTLLANPRAISHSPGPSHICILLVCLFYNPSNPMCAAHVLTGMWGHPLEYGWPTRDHNLKETGPSPRSHALWLTPQIKLRACEALPSALWSIDWLDLIQVSCRCQQLLWAHRCTGLLMPGRGCFAPVLASLTFGSHSASPSSSVMVL